MFSLFRRHQQLFLAILAGLTIISFVAFGPTNTRIANIFKGGASGPNYGVINGEPIDREQLVQAREEVELRYFVNNGGNWLDEATAEKNNINLERETLIRLFIIQKEKDFGINISTEAVAEMARTMLGGMPFDKFEGMLAQRGLNAGDFERFLRHELGIQQLVSLAGLSGKLVTPQEAEELYRKEHQDLNTSMVYFSPSNYLSTVTATPEAVSQFYSNRQASYSIPKQVVVDYVRFNLSNYFPTVEAKLTNLNAMVEEDYKKYGTNAMLAAKTPEEAKAKIRDSILREYAMPLAQKDAMKFRIELDSKSATNLQAVAAGTNATAGTTEPFDEQEGPKGWNVSQAFLKEAFALSPSSPISRAVPAEDGWYVLAYNKTIPSSIPPLKEIQEKVTGDYKMSLAAMAAYQAGSKFANSLTNGLPAGKSFAAVAQESGLKAESVPPFSVSTRSLPAEIEDRINLQRLKQAGFTTEVGKVSTFYPATPGGFVLYVQSKTPASNEQVKKELPDYINMMRQARQNDAFNQWFGQQAQADAGFRQTMQQAMENYQKTHPAAGRRPMS